VRGATPLAAAFLLVAAQGHAAAAASPAPRVGHGMVYDPQRRAVLLFGGTGDGPLGDLWAWDGRAWTELAASGPPPRELPLVGYDTRRRRLVVNGGRARSTTTSETLTDTWEWDGRAWRRRDVAGPTPRVHAVADFDAARQRFVVYGGVDDGGGTLADTWEWDGSRWQQRSSAGPPGCLADHAAYDPTRRKVLMLCLDERAPGADRTYPSSLWEWDGGTWQAVPGAGPVVRLVQPMVALGPRGLLLFDGRGATGSSGYTWLWDRSRWARRGGTAPATRVGHGLAYDPGRRRAVLFGGGDATRPFGDTWEWDGSRWRRAAGP
jgi:hypothetical protein